MIKQTTKILFLSAVCIVGTFGIWTYYKQASSAYRIAQLEEEKRIRDEIIARLTSERRVAEMLVTDQKMVAGVKTTTLLFVETARDGKTPLAPRTFTIRGENAHIDAMVIKFDHELVKENDPLRGRSISLFTKLYGDATAPDQGTPIDPPGTIPAVYQGVDPKVSEFELNLWKDFWKLAYDESARKERGVRALIGQGIWEPVRPGILYTLTLETDGGLSLNREPVKGIYKEALTTPLPPPSPTSPPTTSQPGRKP